MDDHHTVMADAVTIFETLESCFHDSRPITISVKTAVIKAALTFPIASKILCLSAITLSHSVSILAKGSAPIVCLEARTLEAAEQAMK
jgi:hypothetical protein